MRANVRLELAKALIAAGVPTLEVPMHLDFLEPHIGDDDESTPFTTPEAAQAAAASQQQRAAEAEIALGATSRQP